MLYDLPEKLSAVEFSRIRFYLEFQEPFEVTPWMMLRLRRGLRRAGREALSCTGEREEARFERLFEPKLPHDPVFLRRYQLPGPPFAIQPEVDVVGRYEPGDRLCLPVNFFGLGIQSVGDFAAVLQILGRQGLFQGGGHFELEEIEAEDASSNRRTLWRSGRPLRDLELPLVEARWWLENFAAAGPVRRLVFLTPARLLSGGKPLFRPTFPRLFPFHLRRATSMLHAYCRFELEDPRELIALADTVSIASNHLRWKDWRILAGEEGELELGGVGGDVDFAEGIPEPLLPILALGSLMNLGKSAAFGSGYFRLEAG